MFEDLKLWYRQPAQEWVEALPIGNGRLGAMVFGGIQREKIQLNEDSVWSGKPVDQDKPDAAKYLPAARQLLFEGKYAEGEKLVAEKIMGLRLEGGTHCYQTLGDLELIFEQHSNVSDYRRELGLDGAIASVSYRVGDAAFTREVFSSAVDQAIVIRLDCDKPSMITCDVNLSRPSDVNIEIITPDLIVMHEHINDGNGVKFEAQLRVILESGQLITTEKGLRVENANAATLLLVAATDYRGDEPHSTCEKQLADAGKKGYDELRQAHVAEHRRVFRRVELDLGKSDAVNLPTDERLKAMQDGNEDIQLIAQYFQFGRYLLISSSRPGAMSANLQGLWADGLAPPWNADYHININIQMNYWPAEVCNLSEFHQPFFDLIDALRPRGRITARKTYNCGGFVAHHTTDAWHFASAIGSPVYGMWPVAAGWCCQHLWEHYAFGGDQEFLEKQAYPIMKEAAEFFVDFLVEHPKTGYLVSGPSTSPENRFRAANGDVACLTMGCTMDHQVIHDSFTNCIEASQILGIDEEFRQKLEDILSRLAPMKIGRDGRLMEWAEEFEEPEPGHRHMSHLFGLHPGRQITLRGTPELAEAVRKTLDYRLEHGGGHTGWSRAWIINFFARLEDSEQAYENVLALLRQSTLPNLFDNHPPFQIDGNFGGCAGIAEMLIQSHANEIHFLPALPNAWANGHFKGLCARGGLEIDLSWRERHATSAKLKASITGKHRLRPPCGQQIVEVRVGDEVISFQASTGVSPSKKEGGTILLEVQAGKSYEVVFRGK